MSNHDPDDKIKAAFDELRTDAARVRGPGIERRPTPPRRFMPVIVLAAAAIAAIIGVVAITADSGDDEPGDLAAPGTSTSIGPDTTVQSTTSSTTSIPTSAGLAAPLQIEVDEAGNAYYPWIFPPPFLSWYEEGCPEPAVVLENFLGNIMGDFDPSYEVLGSEDHWLSYRVYAKGEGGSVTEEWSIVDLASIDPEVVDCDAWGVVRASSPDNVTIDQPMPNQSVSTGVRVTGRGRGFESQIDLLVLDDRYEDPVGTGFTHGGWEIEPFSGLVMLDRDPLDTNLILVAQSSGAADGAVEPFAAVPIRFGDPLPASNDTQPPIDQEELPEPFDTPTRRGAVVGVDVDDTLNVRAEAGVTNQVVAELSPFDMEVLVHEGSTTVGEDVWIPISHSGPDVIRGWVNERFIARFDAEVPLDPPLEPLLTQIREAISLNAPNERLVDVLAGAGQEIRVVLSRGEGIGREDEVVRMEELPNYAGTFFTDIQDAGLLETAVVMVADGLWGKPAVELMTESGTGVRLDMELREETGLWVLSSIATLI